MRPVRMSPPTSASHDAGLKLSAIAAAATTTATLVAVSSTKRRAATTSRARRPATTRRRSPCSGAHDEDADESSDEGDGELGHLGAVQRLHRRRNPDAVDELDRHQRPPQLVAKGHRHRRRRPLPDHQALLVRAVNQKAASAAASATTVTARTPNQSTCGELCPAPAAINRFAASRVGVSAPPPLEVICGPEKASSDQASITSSEPSSAPVTNAPTTAPMPM